MHEHDAVVVPSRHEFDEGLPMTLQDALTSRTPLVASDHPMLTPRLEHDRSALIFPARDAGALAQCLDRLANDARLYASLSEASTATWERLRLPVLWGNVLARWLSQDPGDQDWLVQHSLARHLYR
jgi:glycosyltransferase involved in cell wall biosynthesis